MKTKKIEVLAPAGNPAALKAAVFAGADAVYMGGSLFSARASAVNFSREEMREAVLFARERNVRVYVTVNTLLKDDELPEALDFCKFLCSVPVDGILIQDMGLFNILREACPEMPLHASTQMSLHTPGGAALLKELGASRVVLAREMSLKEIDALWYDKSHKSGLSEMRVSQNNRKGKNAEQMLHDANDAKELSDDWDRAKDLCYDYNQLRPSKELFAL